MNLKKSQMQHSSLQDDVDIISGEKPSSDPIYMRFVSRLMATFTVTNILNPI